MLISSTASSAPRTCLQTAHNQTRKNHNYFQNQNSKLPHFYVYKTLRRLNSNKNWHIQILPLRRSSEAMTFSSVETTTRFRPAFCVWNTACFTFPIYCWCLYRKINQFFTNPKGCWLDGR